MNKAEDHGTTDHGPQTGQRPVCRRDVLRAETTAVARRLKGPALAQARKITYRLYQFAKAQAKVVPDLAYWADDLLAQVCAFYDEESRREHLAAERKDKGQILFITFRPRRPYATRPEYTVRTPHRLMEFKSYSDAPFTVLRKGAQDHFVQDFNEANGIRADHGTTGTKEAA